MDNYGKDVLRTVKAYLLDNKKYSKEEQSNLYNIFNSSELNIYDTAKYTNNIWNQTSHVGNLFVPIALYKLALELEDKIRDIIKHIYPNKEPRELSSFEISPILIKSDEEYEKFLGGYVAELTTESSATFEKIEDEIIQSIRSAKYCIWVV